MQDRFRVPLDVDASRLYELAKDSHVRLMKSSLPSFAEGKFKEIIQDENLATYWPQRKPEDGQIDLSGSINDAEVLIRAVTKPYPGAFIIENGKKTIVWKSRILQSKEVIPSNSKIIKFKDGILVCEDCEEHNILKDALK